MNIPRRKRKLVVVSGAIALIALVAYGIFMFRLPRARIVELPEREAELTKAVLRLFSDPDDSRIYFLTPTPKEQWGKRGEWASLPAEFHARIAGLPVNYHSASGAYLLGGTVRCRGTQRRAWIRWISIVRWSSETEVIVEDGVWTAPLGGGAHQSVWEFRDHKWQFKKGLGGWVS
jgi:hypothetical protein